MRQSRRTIMNRFIAEKVLSIEHWDIAIAALVTFRYIYVRSNIYRGLQFAGLIEIGIINIQVGANVSTSSLWLKSPKTASAS